MIDYFLKWTDAASAMQDAVSAGHWLSYRDKDSGQQKTAWLNDHVLTNLQVWRASQDTTTIGPKGDTEIVHTYLTGFFACVALNRMANIVINAAAFQFAIDRDKAIARMPGMVIASNIGPMILNDLRWGPVFAGADYPFGALI